MEANRREYLFVLACEIPVLAFALVSSGRPKKLFWLGWGIHAAFSACVLTVVIWAQVFLALVKIAVIGEVESLRAPLPAAGRLSGARFQTGCATVGVLVRSSSTPRPV